MDLTHVVGDLFRQTVARADTVSGAGAVVGSGTGYIRCVPGRIHVRGVVARLVGRAGGTERRHAADQECRYDCDRDESFCSHCV